MRGDRLIIDSSRSELLKSSIAMAQNSGRLFGSRGLATQHDDIDPSIPGPIRV